MRKIHPLAIPALILAAIFGGLAPIFTKLILKELSPFSIVSIRFLSAFLILLSVTGLKKLSALRKDLLKAVFLGFLFSGNIFGFIIGIQYTTAIMSQLVYLLVPLIALILSKIFLRTKVKTFQVLAISLGIIGVGLMLGRSLKGGEEVINSLGSLKGNLIIILGVFTWSAYLILVKILSRKYSSLALTCFSFLTAFLFSIPFFLLEVNSGSWLKAQLTIVGFLGLSALILINSVGMHFLYQWGVKHSSAFTAASVVYLSPLTAAVVAIPLFGEKVTSILLISAGLVFLSVYLATIHPFLIKTKKR